MRSYSYLPLESYRLAETAVQVACYVCSQGNLTSAAQCTHCRAPMALAHQAASQKLPPRLLAVAGPASCGKTVFLGILSDMLSRHQHQLQMVLRGAFSVSLQEATVSQLRRCRFPAPTPSEPGQWNWMHCQLMGRRGVRSELVVPDASGAAMLGEIERAHRYPIVRAMLTRSAGALVLIDAGRLAGGDESPDFSAMKIVSYLLELDGHRRRGWPSRPVAFVFSKADQAPRALDDPLQFARRHTPGLWQVCQQRLGKHRFFAASVAGATAEARCDGQLVPVPLRVEPRGVVEPFAWLSSEIG